MLYERDEEGDGGDQRRVASGDYEPAAHERGTEPGESAAGQVARSADTFAQGANAFAQSADAAHRADDQAVSETDALYQAAQTLHQAAQTVDRERLSKVSREIERNEAARGAQRAQGEERER